MNDNPNLPYFVYVMADPRCGTVKKVGITQRPKIRVKHAMQSGKYGFNRHHEWTQELASLGLRPVLYVVSRVKSKKAAFVIERSVSVALRISGVPIVNGEGGAATRETLKKPY